MSVAEIMFFPTSQFPVSTIACSVTLAHLSNLTLQFIYHLFVWTYYLVSDTALNSSCLVIICWLLFLYSSINYIELPLFSLSHSLGTQPLNFLYQTDSSWRLEHSFLLILVLFLIGCKLRPMLPKQSYISDSITHVNFPHTIFHKFPIV